MPSGVRNSTGVPTARTHGLFGTPVYWVWAAMLARCVNCKNKGFHRYGGRGIKVCERWMKFEHFIADMGNRPTPKHQLERKDNNGNYEPGNCRWATKIEQMRNMRRNHLLAHNGKTQSIAAWADETGLSQKLIASRVNAYGWSASRALTERPR